MNVTYKYTPDDFKGILNLPGELHVLYKLIENYKTVLSDDSWFEMKKQWEDVFFTIKHREVEGFLNPVIAADLRNYLEELINA